MNEWIEYLVFGNFKFEWTCTSSLVQELFSFSYLKEYNEATVLQLPHNHWSLEEWMEYSIQLYSKTLHEPVLIVHIT